MTGEPLDDLEPRIMRNGGHAWLEKPAAFDYGEAYWRKYVGYRGTEIAKGIKRVHVRCGMGLDRHGDLSLQSVGPFYWPEELEACA